MCCWLFLSITWTGKNSLSRINYFFCSHFQYTLVKVLNHKKETGAQHYLKGKARKKIVCGVRKEVQSKKSLSILKFLANCVILIVICLYCWHCYGQHCKHDQLGQQHGQQHKQNGQHGFQCEQDKKENWLFKFLKWFLFQMM